MAQAARSCSRPEDFSGGDDGLPGVKSGTPGLVDEAFFDRLNCDAAAGAVHSEREDVGRVAADAEQVAASTGGRAGRPAFPWPAWRWSPRSGTS
jgi:hypothetical protein